MIHISPTDIDSCVDWRGNPRDPESNSVEPIIYAFDVRDGSGNLLMSYCDHDSGVNDEYLFMLAIVRKANAIDMLEQMESDDFAGVTLQLLPHSSQFDDGLGLVNAIELAHEEYRKIVEEETAE